MFFKLIFTCLALYLTVTPTTVRSAARVASYLYSRSPLAPSPQTDDQLRRLMFREASQLIDAHYAEEERLEKERKRKKSKREGGGGGNGDEPPHRISLSEWLEQPLMRSPRLLLDTVGTGIDFIRYGAGLLSAALEAPPGAGGLSSGQAYSLVPASQRVNPPRDRFVLVKITDGQKPAAGDDGEGVQRLLPTADAVKSGDWEASIQLQVFCAETNGELFPNLVALASDQFLSRQSPFGIGHPSSGRKGGKGAGQMTFRLGKQEVIVGIERAVEALLKEQSAREEKRKAGEDGASSKALHWGASVKAKISPDLGFGFKGFWKWRVIPNQELILVVTLTDLKKL